MYGMAVTGLLVSMAMLQAFAGDNDVAVCNPNSPIVVKQSTVKLFSFTSHGDETDREMIEATESLMGEPILDIENITDAPLTVTVNLHGEGFLVDFSQMMPEENAASWTFELPAGSNIIVPLVYEPATAPKTEGEKGPNGEEIVAGKGLAWVTVEGEQYADYVHQTYLVGLGVTIPEDPYGTSDTGEPVDPSLDPETEREGELPPE